jgi:hypothetical protein
VTFAQINLITAKPEKVLQHMNNSFRSFNRERIVQLGREFGAFPHWVAGISFQG